MKINVIFLLFVIAMILSLSACKSTENGHQYVDLGLPSGTKWATCNVGAKKPIEYGKYYAWGEKSVKSDYSWNTYKYGGDWNKLIKYCTESDFGLNGFEDDQAELNLSDDVVRKQWGGAWHMPSKEQFQELYYNTTSEWTTIKGVEGLLFTASNGKSIFFPAAGSHNGASLNGVCSSGYYWSRTINADYPSGVYGMYFFSNHTYVNVNGYSDRCYGFSVRPVLP